MVNEVIKQIDVDDYNKLSNYWKRYFVSWVDSIQLNSHENRERDWKAYRKYFIDDISIELNDISRR